MIHARFLRLLLGLATLFLGSRSPAQPAAPAPVVDLDFTVFSTGRMPELVFIPTGEPAVDPVPLGFNTAQRSARHHYRGPLPLVFFRRDSTAPGGLRPVARLAKTLPDPGPLLLVFHHQAHANGAYPLIAYPDSVTTLPPRHVNILNLSGHALAAEFNGRALALPAGLTKALDTGDRARLRVAISTEVGWKPAYSHEFVFDPSERATLVLLPPLSPTRPLLPSRLLIDRVGPSPSDTAATPATLTAAHTAP
jgi:hypothetical protein